MTLNGDLTAKSKVWFHSSLALSLFCNSTCKDRCCNSISLRTFTILPIYWLICDTENTNDTARPNCPVMLNRFRVRPRKSSVWYPRLLSRSSCLPISLFKSRRFCVYLLSVVSKSFLAFFRLRIAVRIWLMLEAPLLSYIRPPT